MPNISITNGAATTLGILEMNESTLITDNYTIIGCKITTGASVLIGTSSNNTIILRNSNITALVTTPSFGGIIQYDYNSIITFISTSVSLTISNSSELQY
jgi:hypothetical protein